ncbi:MAG: hypothetical protein AAFZ65_20995, partial [Planctomycetota bacterium]
MGCSAPAKRGTESATFGSWRELSPSWEKLELIDRWIAAEGLSAPAEELLEATLELAESRLELTAIDGASLDARTRKVRLELAANGFAEVADHPLSTDAQRDRASAGLREVEDLGFRATAAERS